MEAEGPGVEGKVIPGGADADMNDELGVGVDARLFPSILPEEEDVILQSPTRRRHSVHCKTGATAEDEDECE